MRVSSAMWLLPVLIAGCTVPTVRPRRDLAATDARVDEANAADSDEADRASDVDDERADEAPEAPAIVYTATLAKMEPHAFGHRSPDGKFFCYFTFFSDVQIELKVTSDGRVASLRFTGTSNEEQNVPECNVVPLQPSRHTYSFSTDEPSGTAVALAPSPENLPKAKLTADVSLESRRLTLHWHRVDVKPPWDWSFTEQVTLSRAEPVR